MDKASYVIKQLKTFLPNLEYKYYTINYGGCGWFARLLYDELFALGIESQIVLLSSWHDRTLGTDDNINRASNVYEIVTDLNTEVQHIVLSVDGHYIDCGNVDKDYENLAVKNKRIVCYLEYETLVRLTDDVGGWNARFNRELIPFIHDDLRIFFHKLTQLIKAQAIDNQPVSRNCFITNGKGI